MPRPADVTAALALWLHLRRSAPQADAPDAPVAAPAGRGPLVLVHLASASGEPVPVDALIRAMLAKRAGLRLVFTGRCPPASELPPDLAATCLTPMSGAQAARAAIATLAPDALLILGDDLPAALITAMAEQHRPVILSEARLGALGPSGTSQGFWRGSWRGPWRGAISRGLMHKVTCILAPDPGAAGMARRLGAAADRIELVGPVTETRPPLSANEAERSALARILAGRHVWLAAAPTLPEARLALAAHQAALHHNHRALLILAGLPADIVPDIRAEVAALGLASVLRSEDEDPSPDDHVLIAEETQEMGLWYRLAPVCFMGGTLLPGTGLAPRHPFEPAALGSAIIHGPLTEPHATEWAQLDGADAARLVSDAAALSRAVVDLTAPDQAALLAGNAWSVSTGGAAVLRRIADAVIATLETPG